MAGFTFAATAGFPLPADEEERWARTAGFAAGCAFAAFDVDRERAATSTTRALPDAARVDLRDADARTATTRDALREPLRMAWAREPRREVSDAAAAE